MLHVMHSTATETRSVYVHVPFCAHRCPYCNFTLIAGRPDLHEAYLDAIELELSTLPDVLEIDTLFFGGGTPTELNCQQLDRLFSIVQNKFQLLGDGEFSIEANPKDITSGLLEVIKRHGVNRVSLGAQSFDNHKLKVLGRDHQAIHIHQAMELLVPKVDSVSLDLIFGTHGESMETWNADLNQAIDLKPQHLSTYGLTYEKGTQYWKSLQSGVLELTDEEVERNMYEHAIDHLAGVGFEHYEVSNFARPGFRCRHNQVYWTGKAFHAFGPGAARFVNGVREVNHRSTTKYLNDVLAGKSAVGEREELSPIDRARERLVFGLRRLEGVCIETLEEEVGFTLSEICGSEIDQLESRGLLQNQAGHIKLTRSGLLVSDSIWPRILVPNDG